MIKNFTVITQRVKNKQQGYMEYSNYLLNQKAKSHKSTEIINLSSQDFNAVSISNISNILKFDSKNTKGGRKVESYGQSLVFSLPDGITPTKEQWEKIAKDIFKDVSKHLFVDKARELNTVELTTIFRATHKVAHNQKNSHLNMVIPRIVDLNGELLRLDNIDKKSFLNSAKNAFNAAALKHLALDFKKLEPENTKTGKSLKTWEKQQKKAAAEQEKASKMLQAAAKKQVEADQAMLQLEKEKRDFNIFKETFNLLLNTIKYYLGNETKKAKLEDKKAVEEYYDKVVENVNFDEIHQDILELAADQTDSELEEEEEKLGPVIRRKRKFRP